MRFYNHCFLFLKLIRIRIIAKSGIQASECSLVVKTIIETCPRLKFAGLMTIGSPNNVIDGKNRDFELLVKCKDQLILKLGLEHVELSMGMSDDFEVAILHGSTNVRVGSSIFGARAYPTSTSQ